MLNVLLHMPCDLQKFNFAGENLLSFLWTKYFKKLLKGKKFPILCSLTDVSVVFRRVGFTV